MAAPILPSPIIPICIVSTLAYRRSPAGMQLPLNIADYQVQAAARRKLTEARAQVGALTDTAPTFALVLLRTDLCEVRAYGRDLL